MMAMCGKTSLLLVVVAMLVQDAFLQPTNELAATDPFETIPSELRQISGWKTIAEHSNPEAGIVKRLVVPDPDNDKKLQTLVALGLNNLRAANGVKTNLTALDGAVEWSAFLSQDLCVEMALNRTILNRSTEEEHSPLFTNYVDYKTEEKQQVSTTDIATEVVRNFYKWAQEKVKKDGVKIETIAAFNPDIKYVGSGISKASVEANKPNESAFYRTCVLTFGNEASKEQIDKILEKKTAPAAAEDTKTPTAVPAA